MGKKQSGRQEVRDILIVLLSYNFRETLKKSKDLYIDGRKIDGEWHHTNEPGAFYIRELLAKQNHALDRVYLFASNKVATEPLNGDYGELTTLDYYKKQLKEHILKISDDRMTVLQYKDDTSKDDGNNKLSDRDILQDNLFSISDFAKTIAADYADQECEVRIHVDMTGGLRHLSMMMLSVLHILGVIKKGKTTFRAGRIIYANYQGTSIAINDATDIYLTTKVVSGLKEFVNYGSVSDLQEYMKICKEAETGLISKDKAFKLDPLQKTITSMEDFCDTVKACKTRQLLQQIKKLRQSFGQFDEKANDSDMVPVKLFRDVFVDIRGKYDKFFGGEEPTYLELITWCLEHDYLQQALTLCTETTMGYLLEQGVVDYGSDELRQTVFETFKEKYKSEIGKEWEKAHLAHYFMMSYLYQKRDEYKYRDLPARIAENLKENLAGKQYLAGQEVEELVNGVIAEWEKQKKSIKDSSQKEIFVDFVTEQHLLKINIGKAEFVKLLEDYDNIRTMRNQVNHADQSTLEVPKVETIRKSIKAYLETLKGLKKTTDTAHAMTVKENKQMIFINFTNHPSDKWSIPQRQAAEKYGKIIDIPFPDVDSTLSSQEIEAMAAAEAKKILKYEPETVLCQGEFSLCFSVVRYLQEAGVTVLAACSRRAVKEIIGDDGITRKTAEFEFIQFREYTLY